MLGSGKWKRVSNDRLNSKEETTQKKIDNRRVAEKIVEPLLLQQYRYTSKRKRREKRWILFAFPIKKHTMPIVTCVRCEKKNQKMSRNLWNQLNFDACPFKTQSNGIQHYLKVDKMFLSMSSCQTKCDKEIHCKINYLINLIIAPKWEWVSMSSEYFGTRFSLLLWFYFRCALHRIECSVWCENKCVCVGNIVISSSKGSFGGNSMFRFNRIDGP